MRSPFAPIDLASYIDDIADDDQSTTADENDDEAARSVSRSESDDAVFVGAKLEWKSDEGVVKPKKKGAAKGKKKSAKKQTKKKESSTATTRRSRAANTLTAKIRQGHIIRVERKDSEIDLAESQDETEESDSDDSPDQALPHYLRMRLDKLRSNTEAGRGPFRLPPKYDNLNLGDHGKLFLRPDFPKSRPRNPDQDIDLHSRGLDPKKSKYTTPVLIGVIPCPIAKWLRDYQIQGAQFLLDRFAWQQGGILADDMGLGKTIQVIAFLTAVFGKTADNRDINRRASFKTANPGKWYPKVLIVCPGSLMDNWTSELNAWGFWQVDRFHGTVAQKQSVLSAAKSGSVEVVITTYTTYRISQAQINLVEWDCVIADECHAIKERSSQITMAMNDVNALCRIGLTGTAIQNDYKELWTLLNWANPGAVSTSRSWKELISAPLRRGQAHDASTHDHGTARRTALALKNELLPRFFLRRWKSLIADQLPKKSDRVVFCPLTKVQASAYTSFLNSSAAQTIRLSQDVCSHGSKQGYCCREFIEDNEAKPWKRYMFPAMHALKNIANHLALLIPDGAKIMEEGSTAKEILQLAVPDLWEGMLEQKDSVHHLNNAEYCGKYKVLVKLLAWWYEHGDKVLIFSHSVKLLSGLRQLFASSDYSCSYLDGSLSYEERTAAVDNFNTDDQQFIFFISVKAGGVGLNITSANKVVIMDPSWNPALDLQAQDRAYRIGQVRDVEVFRLVSIGTIEENIYARQIYKQQQANIGYNASLERRYFSGVQGDKDKQGELFGIKNLFTYHEDEVVLQGIVNKTNIAESKAYNLVADIDLQSQQSDMMAGNNLKQTGGSDPAVKALADSLMANGKGSISKSKSSSNTGARGIEHIMAQAGVQYFHENSEVIGTSKVESGLSRRAMEKTTDEHMDQERLFEQSQIQDPDHRVVYKPAEDIRIRQFCSMAKFANKSTVDFAIQVESWRQEDRRNFLERFYTMRATQLEDEHEEVPSSVT